MALFGKNPSMPMPKSPERPMEKPPQKPPEKPAPKSGLFGNGDYRENWQLNKYLREGAPTRHPKTGSFVERSQREGYAALLKKYRVGESGGFVKDSYRQGIERMKTDWRKMPDGEARRKFLKDIQYLEALPEKK